MTQIDWRSAGYESTKLEYLALKSGFFYDTHNALFDCLAGIELLSMQVAPLGKPAMAQLISNALEETWRVSVIDPPFQLNTAFRTMGYRFSRDAATGKAYWSKELEQAEKDREVSVLIAMDSAVASRVRQVKSDAFDRFSCRA